MSDNKGVSLIEAIVVIGLLAIVTAALVQLNAVFARSVYSGSLGVKANIIAIETMEAARAVKEENWNNIGGLSTETSYYLSFSEQDKKWSVTTSDPGAIGGIFSRSFLIRDVYRNPVTGAIAEFGIPDGNTRQIEANVDWDDRGRPKNLKVTSYLANF